MKTPDQKSNPNLSKEQIKKKYLDEGFIDGSTTYGIELMDKLSFFKKITVVYIGRSTPKIYSGLELREVHDLGGFGFNLPEGPLGSFLSVAKYQRDPKDRDIGKPLKDWLFKIE
jgi:hypothetical protein